MSSKSVSYESGRVDRLLAASTGELQQLYCHARWLLAMERIIQDLMLQDLMPGEIQVVALKDQILSLTTPSATLATRVKYSQAALIASLAIQKDPIIVKAVEIRVGPDLLAACKPMTPTFIARRPSAENGRQIAEAAKYIENTALRTALLRLSEQAEAENQANPSLCDGMAQNAGH